MVMSRISLVQPFLVSCFLSLFISTQVFAIPNITTLTTTTPSNGEVVTVTGSGFGNNTTVTPLLYDNFEDGIDGNVLNNSPQYGTWVLDNRPSSIYSTNKRRAGTTSSYSAYDGQNQWSSFLVRPLPDSDKFYQSFWFLYNTQGTDGQLKLAQVHGPDNPTVGDFAPGVMVGSSTTSWWFAYISTESGKNNYSTRANYPFVPSQNVWHHFEMYLKRSSAGGVNDGSVVINVNNTEVYNKTNVITRESSNYNWKETSFFHGVTNMGAKTDVYIDDAYLSDTWARVEIGNNSDYDKCTHREIQIPTAWDPASDPIKEDSIKVIVNQGSFDGGAKAYLFVVDSDGNVSNGYPVMFPIHLGDIP